MELTIDIQIGKDNQEQLDNLIHFLRMAQTIVQTEEKIAEAAREKEQKEKLVQIPISLWFSWEYNKRRDCMVPRLTGIWIKSYSWMLGGISHDGEIQVQGTVGVPEDIGRAILDNDYRQYNLLPSGKR
jgi:hypothetical protein